MGKRQKRKPDFRRIRPTTVYSFKELADDLDKNIATVRQWHREGMPSLDHCKPPLFDGAVVKKWLRERWANKKSKCGQDEAFCMHCHKARRFAEGSRVNRPHTAKAVLITGKCAVCGCRMNKFASAKSVNFLEAPDARKRVSCAA